MKNLQSSPSEVKMCREKKMSLLMPLIKLLQIDKQFVKMMLPRKINKNNVKDVHLLWSDQVYKDVVNDKYLINFHGAQTNVHLNIDQFMQLIHEIMICHGVQNWELKKLNYHPGLPIVNFTLSIFGKGLFDMGPKYGFG
jgi:hypothetical protein